MALFGQSQTIGLSFSIYLLIGAAFDRAVVNDAEHKARGWANYFAENLPGLPQLIETGKATSEQLAIIITGNGAEYADTLDALRDVSITGILNKPFDPVELLSRLDKLAA